MSKGWDKKVIKRIKELYSDYTYGEIATIINNEFGLDKSANAVRKAYERYKVEPKDFSNKEGPKVLLFDIELFPMEAYIWSIWQDRVGLEMLKTDWSVLSYAAKWLDGDEIFYEDVQGQRDLRDDSKVLKGIWKLLDECDIAVGHNSASFDVKKLNARFAQNGMKPPSTYRQLDTKKMAKKAFSHTSNKLSYLTDKYCAEFKKLSHGKFPGFSLWRECLEGNPEAFKELKKYNEYDVLSLEELFKKLLPWDSSINFSIYNESNEPICTRGS